MKQTILTDAISEIDSDLVEKHLQMRAALAKKPSTASLLIRWSSIAACLLLVVGLGASMLPIMKPASDPQPPIAPSAPITPSGSTASTALSETSRPLETTLPPVTTPPATTEPDLPVSEEDIIWADRNNEAADDVAPFDWNGFLISNELYEALKDAEPTDYIAIQVLPSNRRIPDDYTYNGMTYGELSTKYDDLRSTSMKLEGLLLKDGESLKYGEALYTTGTPNGEKWAKEWYDTVVAYYGEELLAAYIADGELLTDKLNIDLEQVNLDAQEVERVIDELQATHNSEVSAKVYAAFSELDLPLTYRNERLCLFLTRDEFIALDIENKSEYLFIFAYNDPYAGDD